MYTFVEKAVDFQVRIATVGTVCGGIDTKLWLDTFISVYYSIYTLRVEGQLWTTKVLKDIELTVSYETSKRLRNISKITNTNIIERRRVGVFVINTELSRQQYDVIWTVAYLDRNAGRGGV